MYGLCIYNEAVIRMASGGWSFKTILWTLGVRHGGRSGPAVAPNLNPNGGHSQPLIHIMKP